MINNHCYTFQLNNYKEGLLDSFVDVTYILTMVNSERIINIKEQLQKIIPTKKIYIVHNKGYKNCNKILHENIPPYDLTDAYLNTIDHSIKNNFNNILILEDDFIFSERIKDTKIVNELGTFFIKNNNKTFYYNLGPFPCLFYPNLNIFNNTFSGLFCINTQAIIYNKKIQYEIMEYKNKELIKNWDYFLTTTYKNYFYKHPLCYQTFPKTDNQKYWLRNKNDADHFIYKMFDYIVQSLFNILELDKKPLPGYIIVYTICFIYTYTIFIGILFLFFFSVKKLKIY